MFHYFLDRVSHSVDFLLEIDEFALLGVRCNRDLRCLLEVLAFILILHPVLPYFLHILFVVASGGFAIFMHEASLQLYILGLSFRLERGFMGRG